MRDRVIIMLCLTLVALTPLVVIAQSREKKFEILLKALPTEEARAIQTMLKTAPGLTGKTMDAVEASAERTADTTRANLVSMARASGKYVVLLPSPVREQFMSEARSLFTSYEAFATQLMQE